MIIETKTNLYLNSTKLATICNYKLANNKKKTTRIDVIKGAEEEIVLPGLGSDGGVDGTVGIGFGVVVVTGGGLF